MCDTMIAMGSITATGRTMLAKNSDREPNEAQYLTQAPAADHESGTMVRMTYTEIPQVAHTYAHIGSRPWWMWGYEHGVNEHGLAIGNEAEWSRLAAGTEPGLLGMDLLRLTLERAKNADEALEVLTGLIETYGQSGRASTHRDMFYQNAFILADARKAWVLETAGRHWVARKVVDWAAISNVYSIGTTYDRISAEAISFAVAQGWHDPAQPFDWAASYTDEGLSFLPSCRARLSMSQGGMGELARLGGIGLSDMFARLRDHGDTPEGWTPGEDAQGMVCMHCHSAHEGSETVASMVAELAEDADPLIWTSLCSPCMAGFVPVWIGSDLPPHWEQPGTGAPDAWWQMQHLQRLAEHDYSATAPMLRAAFDSVEAQAMTAVAQLSPGADAATRAALTARIATKQAAAAALLTARLEETSVTGTAGWRASLLRDLAETAPQTHAREIV